jgi:hypothetical protein
VASKRTKTEETEVDSAPEISTPSAQAPCAPKPSKKEIVGKKETVRMPEGGHIDIEDFFKDIEFKDELERVKADVFVKDFQSPMKDTRTKALERLKEIPRPQAVGILAKLLPGEEDPLRINEILDTLSSLDHEAKLKKRIFTDFLRHPNPILRQAALRALARYKDEESFSILSSCLEDEDAEVRRQTLNCLSWFFGDRCVPAALELLHDVSGHVRTTAAFICGAFKVPQSIPALITLLSDTEREVQKNTLASLKKITGHNFGFKITGRKRQKDAAIKKWHRWWHENYAKFGM